MPLRALVIEEPPAPTPPEPPGEEAPSQLIRHAVVLQLKLLLEGMKDILLGPVALVALAVDLLVRRKRDGRLFYDTLRGSARFEDFLNLYGALPERRDSDDVEVGTTIDRFINRAEHRLQEGARRRRGSIDGPRDRG